MTGILRTAGLCVATAFLIWIIGTFILQPILAALGSAFLGNGEPTLTAASDLMASNRVREAIWNTAWITVLTLITVNIVGLFQVVVLEYLEIRGAGILRLGYATPLVYTSVVAVSGYKFAYGEYGVFTKGLLFLFPDMAPDWFEGGGAVLLSHTFLMTSYHFLFLRAAMQRVDYSTIEAARSLGASHLHTFFGVVMPVLLPTLFAVSLLVAYEALGALAPALLLGGRDFTVVSEMILALNSIRRQDMAAMLALLLGAVILACVLALQYVEGRGSYTGAGKTPVRIQKVRLTVPVVNAAVHALAYLLFAIMVFPVVLTILFSFAPARSIETEVFPSSFTFGNYVKVFTDADALTPFLNSARMGLAASAAGLCVSLLAVVLIHKYRNGWTRLLDFSFFLPWVLPAALLAIGMIIAFDRPNTLIFGQALLGGFWILPLAFMVAALPMMVRFLRAAFWNLDDSLPEAARALGAGPFGTFRRVTFPLILPVVILVGAMQFNSMVSEYTLSAFLFNVNNQPLSVALVEGARDPDPERVAVNLVYMTLIMAFSFAVIICADRYGLRDTRQS